MSTSASYALPSRFIAIDFETATRAKDSACAVAVVTVVDLTIISRWQTLICPPVVSHEFERLHGITPAQMKRAPTFEQCWPELRQQLQRAGHVLAHHAAFDQHVLTVCCERIGVRPPPLTFHCTEWMARELLGIEPASLANVCAELDISHTPHDALADATACATIGMRLSRLNEPC